MRILVVDDQVDFLRLVASWLGMLKGILAVEVSPSPTGALARLDELKPDVVITDIQMPEMNGLDFTRLLKARPTPPVVIVMTGLESAVFRAQAHAAGADFFLEKSLLHKKLPSFLAERFGVGQAPF
jgi:two-component system C4-dicarboxylate transport response regulator DctD